MKRIVATVIAAICTAAVLVALLGYSVFSPRLLVILTTGSIQADIVPSREGETRVGGMLLLASALNTLRHSTYKDNVLLLDAGNSLFDDPDHIEFSKKMPVLLRKLGFDAITLGYRDFSIASKLDWTDSVPVLACNVTGQLGTLQFAPSKLFTTKRGERVAVIGVVDPDTVSYQPPSRIGDINILGKDDSIKRVTEEVERWKDKTDAVILLSSAIDPAVNVSFAMGVSHIDAIIGVEESRHGSIVKIGKTTIVSAASGGRTIGVVHAVQSQKDTKLTLEARSQIDVNSEQFRSDPEFYEIVRRYWIDYIRHSATNFPIDDRRLSGNHVIGFVWNSKDQSDAAGIPLELSHPIVLQHPYWSYFDSPMLRLVADALREEYPRWDADHTKGVAAKPVKVDIAFVNTGTLEAGLPAGIVTAAMLRHALPYDNKIIKTMMSREQIIQMLSSPGMKRRGILGVSGLTYVWDFNTGRVDEDSLKLVVADAMPVSLTNRQYVVLVSDFLATGGDGYMQDKSFYELRDRIKTVHADPSPDYPSMVELLMRYIYRESPIQASTESRVHFLR